MDDMDFMDCMDAHNGTRWPFPSICISRKQAIASSPTCVIF